MCPCQTVWLYLRDKIKLWKNHPDSIVRVIIYILLFGFLQVFECCPLSRIVYRDTFLEKHIIIFRKPRLTELCIRKALLACGNVHFGNSYKLAVALVNSTPKSVVSYVGNAYI